MKNQSVRAAIYLRSSKDRSDVSIDAQRRQLQELAEARGLVIVEEFADVVESGKDENRPGFQSMIAAVRNPKRGWGALLALDTSRIARRRHISIVFEEVEAKRHDVRVIYKSLPDSDPITEMLLKSILQAMDEWHSLTSKAKGLAGMSENVRKGFRAGGRAPFGYRLEKHHTGAMREGAPVTKTKLVPDDGFELAQRYLRARAEGVPRSQAARDSGIPLQLSSLVGMDWNALTYAGCTVWNVHQEHQAGFGYKGQRKRRPRSEWVIQDDTHQPAITREQAEVILHTMQTADIGEAIRRGKTAANDYILTGFLFSPAGTPWEGSHRKYYRYRGEGGARYVLLRDIDKAVLEQLLGDLRSPTFVDMLVKGSTVKHQPRARDRATIHREVVTINEQISRAMDAAMHLEDPAPAYRKVDELERRRKALADEEARIAEDEQLRLATKRFTPERVTELLEQYAQRLESAGESENRAQLKDALRSLVDRIELDPAELSCQIHYRIQATRPVESRGPMAFPRGFEPRLPP